MTTSFEDFKEAHANYSSTGAHKPESWKKVLDILNREDWTPHEYLDYVFKEYKRPMVPIILHSDDTVEKYRQARLERIALNKRRTSWVMKQAKVRLDNGCSLEDILKDKELESHTLFMYLMASQSKMEEAKKKYLEPALYELRTMPELRALYSIFNSRYFPDREDQAETRSPYSFE